MAKEIVKQEDKKVSAMAVFAKKSEAANIDRKDLLIPKLLTMQGLSKLVAAEKATMGDIVNSVTGEVLGGKSKPVNVIPLKIFKTWVRYKIQGGSPMYIGTEPFTPENANRPWEESVDGGKIRNDQALNFYVMLEEDMKKPFALPFVLSFRRTSYRNGRKLVNHFAQAEAIHQEAFGGTVELRTEKQQNDQGIFYVFDVGATKATNPEYAAKCELWMKTLAEAKVTIDDSDEEEKVSSSAGAATSAPKDLF